MSFFKNLFGRKKATVEPFIPTPTQQVPGLEPIIVQAIENSYPNIDDQKQAFRYSLKFKEGKKGNTHALLALLSYSQGKIANLRDLDSPNLETAIYKIITEEGLPNMKAAEEWVQSITKPKA